jgi:14-3-3 protein
VFYYKMKGDYHRYLSEFQGHDSRKESSDKALEAYQVGSAVAAMCINVIVYLVAQRSVKRICQSYLLATLHTRSCRSITAGQ